jgi:hypothetical protein
MERQAVLWTISGIVVGVAASVGLGRLSKGLLFGITPDDPLSLGAAIAMLAVVAIVAAWWPSKRASLADPAISLRQD